MSTETYLLDLVVQWEELRAAGRDITPEELCQDRPEIVGDLRDRLQALDAFEHVLGVGDEPSSAEQLPTTQVQPALAQLGPSADSQRPVRGGRPAISGYEILEEIGRGGMGIVYRGRQLGLDRVVAIKTIFPCGPTRDLQARRFLQEAKAMAMLQEPNVVQVYETGDCDGYLYLVMEYVPGGTLSDKLGGKPMPADKAAELMVGLAHGVHAAHHRGVIHRDLKPGNIFLAADGTAKIGDFGLAKWFQSSSDCTQTGQVLGTPSYMAPEQISTEHGLMGPRVDVYALGAVLYELLTGHPPFVADNQLSCLQLILWQEPVPPCRLQPKIPRDLETICLKCLEKDPRRRYPSALALGDDLQRFIEGRPLNARPVGPIERCWRWARGHRSVAALMLVGAAALLTLLTVVGLFNRSLSAELQRTSEEHRQVLAVGEKLDRALTREIAERLDSDLRELAAVPSTVAAMLEKGTIDDEHVLESMLRELMTRSPLIFGLCVAFEPFAWQPDREDFALYVFRQRGELAVKQLLPPVYRSLYRQWPWYRIARDAPHGRWSEPYVDDGGDHTPMVTFSAPVVRQGRFVGVVTADLAVEYFRGLRRRLDDLDVGPGAYCSVVSAQGKIMAHRDDCYEFPCLQSDLTKLPLDDGFRRMVAQWGHAADGTAQAIDFATGHQATFLFSPVPSTGWTVVLTK